MTVKNRERSPYSFANINFLGKCNLNCFFCLGKDLQEEFSKYDHTITHFPNFKNLDIFLSKCSENNIKQLYITGQNVDPLQYRYLDEFREILQKKGFYVGLRTNGMLGMISMNDINKFNTCKGDAVGYTLLTLNKQKMILMTGSKFIPNWIFIFNNTQVPFRVSIVITKYNYKELMNLIYFISSFSFNKNLKYIQLRKISSDTREERLNVHAKAFEEVKTFLKMNYIVINEYEKAPIYKINGIDVLLWETVATTANSLNYFTNGVVSDEYFIIEGYLKHRNDDISSQYLEMETFI